MQILSMSDLLSELRQGEIEYGPQTMILPELLEEYEALVSTAREATELVAQMAAAHAYMQAVLPVLQAKIRLQYSLPADTPLHIDLELGTFQIGTKKVQGPKVPDWAEEALKSADTPLQ